MVKETRLMKLILFMVILVISFYLISSYWFKLKNASDVLDNFYKLKNDIISSQCKSSNDEANLNKKEYYSKCYDLFKKMRYPDKKLVFRPPLKEPPADMLKEFTQNGSLPLTKLWYFDDSYPDSDRPSSDIKHTYTQQELNNWLYKIKNNQPLGYNDLSLKEIMFAFTPWLKNKSMVVIGTIEIWIEAISYAIGCSNITTLDYTHKAYEMKNFKWYHVNDYLEEAMKNYEFENYDNSASYSSIEHAGLGRFGDPLAPNGDIEAVQQVHCMLKPGGILFLLIETAEQEKGSLEFNAQRIYGYSRLRLLFRGWNLLARYKNIHVLQKVSYY